MSRTLYISLATACLLAVGVHATPPVAGYDAGATTALPDTPVGTTQTPPEDSDNSTAEGFSVTDYYYLDYPRIGYHIFLRKMLEALRILNMFMHMDPTLLKITRTYLFSNDTDNAADNNGTLTESNDLQADQPVETNTEAPPAVALAKKTGKTEKNDKHKSDKAEMPIIPYDSHKADKSKESDAVIASGKFTDKSQEADEEDVKKTKVNDSLITKAAGFVNNIYHSLTDWIG